MNPEITYSSEELLLIEQMQRIGADGRGILTQILCGRSEQVSREPLLDQIIPFWQQKLPQESLEKLRLFLDAYYREEADLARQRVKIGLEGLANMGYTWWIDRATLPVEMDASATDDSIQILGQQLRDCILSRDEDGWLKGLVACLSALKSNPTQGGSTRKLMLEMETFGSAEYRKADMLRKFDVFCHKNQRLPTIGELNFDCGLDKNNAFRYRKELGLNGIPKIDRSIIR